MVEYSLPTQVNLPPEASFGIERALDTRKILEPKTGSIYVAPALGGINVLYPVAGSTIPLTICEKAEPIGRMNRRGRIRAMRMTGFRCDRRCTTRARARSR